MAEVQYIPDPRDGQTPDSRAFDCCDACVAPTAPSSVEALAAGGFVADVTWTDNATDETGYEVRWRNLTTGGEFVSSPDRPANSTTATVTVTGATDGDLIEIQVRAVNLDCGSDWISDEVNIVDTN